MHGHSHDIQIKKQGLVQICTTSNDEVTIGPRKGANLKGIAFVIKIDGDKIFEAVGLLEKDKPVV